MKASVRYSYSFPNSFSISIFTTIIFFLGCCFSSLANAHQLSDLISKDGTTNPPWRLVGIPPSQSVVPTTTFEVAQVQSETALKVATHASYGTWVHELPSLTPGQLQWRWRLDSPLNGGKTAADIQTKAGDDAALKICVMFDHPIEQVPFVERTILRIARRVSGENLPAATICYIWDSVYNVGFKAANPYTKRVRFMVLQGKNSALGQWKTENRDLAADFATLFADELPSTNKNAIPKVKAVLIGADSDNTGAKSVAWVSSITWK